MPFYPNNPSAHPKNTSLTEGLSGRYFDGFRNAELWISSRDSRRLCLKSAFYPKSPVVK